MALSNLLNMMSNGAGQDDLQSCHLNDSMILYSHWEKLKTVGNSKLSELVHMAPNIRLTTLRLALRTT